MKIFIQSKSGDYNAEMDLRAAENLGEALRILAMRGGYYTEYRGKKVRVPYSEIQHVEATE